MSDAALAAIINGSFGLIVLVLGARLNRKVNRVQDQVVNGHSTNMREEADERHNENSHKLDRALDILHSLQANVAQLWERSAHQGDQIHELETTQSRTPAAKRKKPL